MGKNIWNKIYEGNQAKNEAIAAANVRRTQNFFVRLQDTSILMKNITKEVTAETVESHSSRCAIEDKMKAKFFRAEDIVREMSRQGLGLTDEMYSVMTKLRLSIDCLSPKGSGLATANFSEKNLQDIFTNSMEAVKVRNELLSEAISEWERATIERESL